jgi:RNA polymerase sigma factor (sigma-70 family)
MEQIIRQNMRSAERIVRAAAYKWGIPLHEHDDVFQESMARTIQYWKPAKAKDPVAYFLGTVYLDAKTIVMRLKGYHNGNKRPQSVKAAGECSTYSVGLYQPVDEGEILLLDERIMPTVPSAEDVYLATVPTKRQQALRRAVDSLPEFQRVALTHQFYEELSVADSASLMGLTTNEVSTLRSNAVRSLKRRMNA